MNLRLIILFFEIIFYCLYFYFTFNFIKKINFSSIDLLAFFCPIFLFASIADFEMLGRKEVIFFIFIIIFFSNLNNIYLINKKYLLFFILPLIILTYETVIFYLIFIGFVFLIKKNLNFKDLFKVIIYFFPSIIVTFLIFYNPQSKINNSIMCNALETINEKCGLAAAFTTKHITDHIAEVNWKIFSIVKYFLLLLFSYFPILFLSFNVKYNKNMVNSFIIKIPFYLIFIIINLTTFIMYFIAVDSARWSVISYTSSYFFLCSSERKFYYFKT